jgi:predicted ATPase
LQRLYAEQWHAAELPVPARAPLPRITQVLVEGMRSVRKCHLDVDGLTVLVGANGSGKSTLVEACELLRRMASPNFLDELHSIHGGAHALLRHGSTALKLGLVVDDGDTPTALHRHA